MSRERELAALQFQIGPIPQSADFHPEIDGWLPLKKPSLWIAQVLAVPIAVAVAFVLIQAWILIGGAEWSKTTLPLVFLLILPGLLVAIPLHEVVHAAFHPHWGLSDATTLGVWPQRVVGYAHYKGELSRNRFMLILAAPLLMLSVAPLILCAALSIAPPPVVAVSIANGVGACVDLLSIALLGIRLPSTAVVRNQGEDSWWRSPA